MTKELIARLDKKNAVIGIIGLGYVGIPLMVRYAEVGYKVLGFDINSYKVNKLNNGESYINQISSDIIKQSIVKGFEATYDFSRASEVDAIILCVQTPLNKHREPDLSFIISTINKVIPYIKKGQVISLQSTTYPGTTEEELLPRIESTGLEVGKDIYLVYSPEREDPGNINFTTKTIPKVVGGYTDNCLNVGKALYKSIINQVVPVSSLKIAEMTKLLENIHRSVNIGLVNEMKIVADRMGIDIYEVIAAASTKPFGFTAYYPGPGLGGHCIPIDPFYLTWKAKEYGVNTRFIELAGEVNATMPYWVLGKITDVLSQYNKSLKNSKVLILGIAYKKDVDDIRESPAVKLMELLKEKGAVIDYSDPYIPIFPRTEEIYFDLKSIELTPENIIRYDLLLLVTNHSKFDYKLLKKHAKLIVDTRGVYLDSSSNIVRA